MDMLATPQQASITGTGPALLSPSPSPSASTFLHSSITPPPAITTPTTSTTTTTTITTTTVCDAVAGPMRPPASSGSGGAEEGEENDAPRLRLTREQVMLLEKQFHETAKPTAAVRCAIAQRTGLSMQRVANWFQNRRVKAKNQKRQEELQVMQVLENASRRRMTEPSSPVQQQSQPAEMSSSSSTSSSSKASKAAGRRRAKSESATARLNSTSTTTRTILTPNFSPYASPTEASYASLARSLAQAAAAVRQASLAGGFNEYSHEIPKPVLTGVSLNIDYSNDFALIGLDPDASGIWQQPKSAFSDWGSSRNSIAAYTPTPAGQMEDPFEFDNIPSARPTAPLLHPNPEPVQEDFNMFAAAIEMNMHNRPFIMPAFPTNGLMKRRQMSPLCVEPQNTSSLQSPPFVDRRDSCPSDAFSAFNTQTPDSFGPDAGPSLAARRKQNCPSLLDSSISLSISPGRSNSFNESISESSFDGNNPLRRPRSNDDDTDKRSRLCTGLGQSDTPSPFSLNIFNSTPTFSSKLRLSIGPLPDLPSPATAEADPHMINSENSSPHTRAVEQIPELGFTASATPESATFDNNLVSIPPPPPDTYHIHQYHQYNHHPEQLFFKQAGFASYYDFAASEGSSASSEILMGKDTNAFPFEDFLTARFHKTSSQTENAGHQSMPYI